MSRRQVQAEILINPVDIIFIRKTQVDDGAGGWVWSDPTPTDPQRVRIIPAKRSLSEMLVNTELGHIVEYPFIVLAMYNANIQRDDEFWHAGDHYQVKSIYPETQESLIAQVDYFGGETNG